MLAGIFAALAGYERDLMHERATPARAADVALNQLTANPDTVAAPGPGDQRDAAARPDRKRRPYKAP